MPSLKELLDTWAQRIGAPQLQGYVSYALPQRGSTIDECSVDIVAPFDGYAQVAAWYCYNAGIVNNTIFIDAGGLSDGRFWGGSTNPSDNRAFVPCRKGDSIHVQLSVTTDKAAEVQGGITFFPRAGFSSSS